MRRVAYLVSANVLPDVVDRRGDAFEVDVQWEALAPACRAVGVELVPVAWDDRGADPEQWAAIVVGPTWDYESRPTEFLSRLEALASVRPLLNPLGIIRWNLNKTYLRDLERAGVPTVPTRWLADPTPTDVQAAMDGFEADAVVVKRVVGANAHGQVRCSRIGGADGPLPAGDTMIQPFIGSITTEGELSMLSFDRRFSHAVRKLPAQGDYRVQSTYGGRELAVAPSAEALAIHEAALAAVHGPLLLARTDLVRDNTGQLCVIELELIEPFLYPQQAPRCGQAFADALSRLLTEATLAPPSDAG